MLAIAIVHRDDGIEAERARAPETIAQSLAFAERCFVADQRDRQIGHVFDRRIRGTVIDDDHVRTQREHGFDYAADRALFVERGNDDHDATRIARAPRSIHLDAQRRFRPGCDAHARRFKPAERDEQRHHLRGHRVARKRREKRRRFRRRRGTLLHGLNR